MDARLYRIRGHRSTTLRRDDLPRVTSAIMDLIIGTAKAFRIEKLNVPSILIMMSNSSLLIRGDDWAKIVPALEGLAPGVPTNLFSPSSFRTGALGVPASSDMPAAQRDPELYNRIMLFLQPLFPEQFPTSQL